MALAGEMQQKTGTPKPAARAFKPLEILLLILLEMMHIQTPIMTLILALSIRNSLHFMLLSYGLKLS